MRRLSFIIVIVFAAGAAGLRAQTPPTAAAAATGAAFENGARAARAEDYEKALEQFRAALHFSKNETAGAGSGGARLAKIHFNMGVCLYHLRRPGEAVAALTEAVRLSRGGYQKAFYALGMAQIDLRNWAAAAAALRQAVRLEPGDGEAWFDLALVLLEKNELEAAKEAFQNAIRHKSRAAADAHNNIGVILALKGDIVSAENEFKTALRASGGKSQEALDNLKFCDSYKQSFNPAAPTPPPAAAAQLSFARDPRE